MQAPTLFVLAADLTRMQVNASIDEADVGRVESAQAVRFRVDAFPEREFDGRVKQVRLQPTTVQNVVTYTAVITADNPEQLLKPGMTASVTIEVARRDDALQVPAAALRFKPDAETLSAFAAESGQAEARGTTVWTLDDNRLARVAVRTGLSNGAQTEVRPVDGADLREGAQVVTGVASVASSNTEGTQNPFAPGRPRRTTTRGTNR
jgi:HlyD family secretion protein